MNDRLDYEHLERDNDGLNYWFTNRDVETWWRIRDDKAFADAIEWHDKKQSELASHSLFYKGTALYFTYKDRKYYVSWPFYSDEYIIGLQKRLKKIEGVSNIQINFGELD